MAEGARIYSTDVVRQFRAALVKYAETGNVALTSADGEIDRTLGWLEREQTTYWAGQVRKRHEMVIRCEDAVRQKKLFKGADGGTQSVVDEMKALATAKRREEEAQYKVAAVKKAIQVLRKEGQLYKGKVMRLATTMTADIPRAIHRLDRMMDDVAHYLSIQTQGKGLEVAASGESLAQALGQLGQKSTVDKLRARTPKPEQRQGAAFVAPAADHPVRQPWGVGTAADWQRKALAGLSIDRKAPEPDQRIVAHPDVWQQPKVYLERLDPTGDDDSGWYVGPAGDAEPAADAAYQALRVGDVVAARPDLADFLALPVGMLALFDAGGPAAVYDPMGIDIWSIALIHAAEPAADDAPSAEGAAAVGDATGATPPTTEAEAATTA